MKWKVKKKKVQVELMCVWRIKHKWILEAGKFMLSAEKEGENIYYAY